MLKQTNDKNTNASYVISPCYRLVMPSEEQRKDDRRSGERRVDTPRGSAVRRLPLDW